MINQKRPNGEHIWDEFAVRQQLTKTQLEQFKTYYEMIKETNIIHNITAITDLQAVINDHFDDSLALCDLTNCQALNGIADIGTGAGFPSIPIKIKYPHLKMVLIEVTRKKIDFLASVIEKLGLVDIEIADIDWRNFLRKTEYPIDLFCARASVQPSELVRLFKPSSVYRNARLVYWASRHWTPEDIEKPFIEQEKSYTIGKKRRRLVFFRNIQNGTLT